MLVARISPSRAHCVLHIPPVKPSQFGAQNGRFIEASSTTAGQLESGPRLVTMAPSGLELGAVSTASHGSPGRDPSGGAHTPVAA